MQPKITGGLLFSIACLFICTNCLGQSFSLGKEVGSKPELFYPDDLSDNNFQWNNWLVKGETEIFYTIQDNVRSYIVKRRLYHDRLGPIEKLPFDPAHNYSHPWVNEQGNHLIFQASLPNPETGDTDFSIWESWLEPTGWSTPVLFSEATSSVNNEGAPILSETGNLYFNMTKEGSGDADLFVLKKGDRKATRLPNSINSNQFEGDFFVDKQERYIIFSSYERENSAGQSDLYISFKERNTWSAAVWLGRKINSNQQDFSPYVTDDGKFLVFTSSRLSQNRIRPSFNHFIVKFDVNKYRQGVH